jgi:hypothetical protein
MRNRFTTTLLVGANRSGSSSLVTSSERYPTTQAASHSEANVSYRECIRMTVGLDVVDTRLTFR